MGREDGRQATLRRERRRREAAGQPDAPEGEAETEGHAADVQDPENLPPYEDPKGRKIMPRHRRAALRKTREMGLKPANVNHAFHLLAARGIDVVTGRESMLALAQQAKEIESKKDAPASQGRSLTVLEDPDEHNALTTTSRGDQGGGLMSEAEREAGIRQIQRDLVKRRRKRVMALFLRLFVFVLLPTAAFGYYYTFIATPMYETESQFVIQTSESTAGGANPFGNILAGTGLASSQDSIVVQGYLTSREAFNRLDDDFDYVEHFQSPQIDVIQRLPADATEDDAYTYFQDKVTIGYDPTEGVIRMTVVAATPEASQQFAEALVGYAEERVDGLSREARGDQLQTAIQRMEQAEQESIEAELKVLELQERLGVVNAEAELTGQMSLINELEVQLENERLALREKLANPSPNRAQVEVAERRIAFLEDRIRELRAQMTNSSESQTSLAEVSRELRGAELRLATRQLMLQEAITAVTTAQTEANRQVRYLSLGVAPVAPSEPTYPRKFESTLLAFVVFLGIYILVSLTISILREQISV